VSSTLWGVIVKGFDQLLELRGRLESLDGFLIVQPRRPQFLPFFVVPEYSGTFASFGGIKEILEFGAAAVAQIQIGRGGEMRAGGLFTLKVQSAHGTPEVTRGALNRPLERLDLVALAFCLPFSFPDFDLVCDIQDIVHLNGLAFNRFARHGPPLTFQSYHSPVRESREGKACWMSVRFRR
jgi:hypothetical protein